MRGQKVRDGVNVSVYDSGDDCKCTQYLYGNGSCQLWKKTEFPTNADWRFFSVTPGASDSDSGKAHEELCGRAVTVHSQPPNQDQGRMIVAAVADIQDGPQDDQAVSGWLQLAGRLGKHR